MTKQKLLSSQSVDKNLTGDPKKWEEPELIFKLVFFF